MILELNAEIFGAVIFGAIVDCNEAVAHIRIDQGHPWRPPFGLERIGQPLRGVVEISSTKQPFREYWVSGYLDENEIERHSLDLTGNLPYRATVTFNERPNEVVLFAQCKGGPPVELARESIQLPLLEADAIARTEKLIHPIDLGTVLVPRDWLLLADGQTAIVDIAAISHTDQITGARVTSWFDSAPQKKASTDIELKKGRRVQMNMRLHVDSPTVDRDVLHVNIAGADGKELWQKEIQTMLVHEPPQLPKFGATETKLRYDAPISVHDSEKDTWSSIDYEKAWPAHLKDVVVSLPNGSRFVFWRGSSYVPFWAGRQNTGLSYEWAETSPPPDGYVDSVEPLMDKELRYGRVEIVESTAARVHVRWSYQSTDFKYKVWGDSAVEDFYFYPDSFGTRVLTIQGVPDSDNELDYEVSEFIVLTPQGAYPFDVLPSNAVDILFIDGRERKLSFPDLKIGESSNVPAVYRIRLHKDEAAAAIYFNPNETSLPPHPFEPFSDRGEIVTPAYWGNHWPLTRGKTTGWGIDNIHLGPAHNSFLSWGRKRPTPISKTTKETLDTLGRSKLMTVQRWVWLIGMTEASNARLLEWARSFSKPPSLEIKCARFDFDSYVPERRATRLIVEEKTVKIKIKPTVRCVNPVFELLSAPGALVSVTLAERALKPNEYAWDGKTLWLNANIDKTEKLRVEFGTSSRMKEK